MKNSGSNRCVSCQAINEPDSLFCSRCGASLGVPALPGEVRRRRRVTASGAALGTALLVLLLAVAFTMGAIAYRVLRPGEDIDPYTNVPGTTASTTASSTPGTSTDAANTSTTKAGTLIRPQAASASSVLKPTSSNTYRATNLLDGDVATAWNEGVEGPGIGQWVRFEFLEPVILAKLEIANGYQKDDERFSGNIRVKSLKLEYSTGATQLVDLLDTKDFQSVKAARVNTEWIKLTIVSVYPDYVWADAALSEVRIFALAGQE